jgi:hypothetical protein
MRKLSSLVLPILGLFFASVVMASTPAIHDGEYYVGPGDGSTVVFRPLPGGKAVIAPVETINTAKSRLKPSTRKMVIQSAEGGYTGILKKVSPGHYDFILGSPAKPASYCIHTVTVKPNGVLIQEPKLQRGCMYYHGASWGYSNYLGYVLKPYNVGK